MIVRNIISARSNKAVANQFIIKSDKAIYFQSYASLIAKIDKTTEQVTLSSYWDYSATTRKYLYQFLDSYGYTGMNGKRVQSYIEEGKFKYVDLITD